MSQTKRVIKRSRKAAAPVTVAVATGKGGPGKSTISMMLAGLLAEAGEKVLLVDLDPEAHSTWGVGGDLELPGTANLLLDKEFELQSPFENLQLLAGGRELESGTILRFDVEKLADDLEGMEFDYIIIDCPGNSHELTKFGIAAADKVLIPITAHPFTMQNADLILEDLERGAEKKRRGPQKWALVANMFNEGRILDKQLLDSLNSDYSEVDHFIIHRSETLAQCSAVQEQYTLGLLGKNKKNAQQMIKWLKD